MHLLPTFGLMSRAAEFHRRSGSVNLHGIEKELVERDAKYIVVHINSRYHTHRGVSLRTNIVLNDDLISEAQKLTSLPTKKAVVDEALRTLIRLKKQETVLSLRGKIHWRGDLNRSRTGR